MEEYVFLDADRNKISIEVFDDNDQAEAHRVEIEADSFEVAREFYRTLSERRQERTNVFKRTVDRMNPVWFETLSDDQKARLSTWRGEWLDYPQSGETPTTNVEDIF